MFGAPSPTQRHIQFTMTSKDIWQHWHSVVHYIDLVIAIHEEFDNSPCILPSLASEFVGVTDLSKFEGYPVGHNININIRKFSSIYH